MINKTKWVDQNLSEQKFTNQQTNPCMGAKPGYQKK